MLGAPLDALKTAAEASPFLEHLSSTALQASLLLFADVHRVCGNSKDAEEYALGAFHESREIPKQYSGVFARWLAIVGPRLDDKWSRSTLEELHCQRGQLDSLDRAEVTAALASCTSDVPRRTDLEKCLEEELAGLPAGIRDFLTAFQAA
jgi:hypothetical protein